VFWFLRRSFGASIRWLLCATVLFGVVYPCAVWVASHLFFFEQAEGSRIVVQGRIVGLRSVGQPFSSQKYFFSRPSEAPQGSFLVSGASNLSWSSPILRKKAEERARVFPSAMYVPEDMLMASASGLDPDISVRAAIAQVERVAAARNMSQDDVRAIVFSEEEPTLLGLFPRRVNVLRLNRHLDAAGPP
jgi:potassium-transporting ATPase KdpC subunit